MDITFIENKEEIVIHANKPKGAKWLARNITDNLSGGIHYTDKKRALHLLNTAADDGVKVARTGVDGGAGTLIVTGEYHETGYEIFVNGESVYSAGNSDSDSQLRVPPKRGVGLKTLRKFCVKTGKEMAFERFAKWGGCERIPDPLKDEL